MNRWGVCLGVLCFLSTVGRAQEQPTKFEVGPFFTYLRIPDSSPINAQNQAELGGRFSWNFARHFALDAELEASPFRTTNLTTAYQGGYLSQGFAGVKSGKRWNRFGFCGKFRAGFNSYSGAIIQASQTASLTFGRRTDPSLTSEAFLNSMCQLGFSSGTTSETRLFNTILRRSWLQAASLFPCQARSGTISNSQPQLRFDFNAEVIVIQWLSRQHGGE